MNRNVRDQGDPNVLPKKKEYQKVILPFK